MSTCVRLAQLRMQRHALTVLKEAWSLRVCLRLTLRCTALHGQKGSTDFKCECAAALHSTESIRHRVRPSSPVFACPPSLPPSLPPCVFRCV
eukprot:2925389-Rhodomonas_salina.2